MPDTSAMLDALHGIASPIDADMSEKDVENAFLNEGFYNLLGYKGAGHDLRSEWTLADDKRPDYVTLDANELVTVVYEFKTSGIDLLVRYPVELVHDLVDQRVRPLDLRLELLGRFFWSRGSSPGPRGRRRRPAA